MKLLSFFKSGNTHTPEPEFEGPGTDLEKIEKALQKQGCNIADVMCVFQVDAHSVPFIEVLVSKEEYSRHKGKTLCLIMTDKKSNKGGQIHVVSPVPQPIKEQEVFEFEKFEGIGRTLQALNLVKIKIDSERERYVGVNPAKYTVLPEQHYVGEKPFVYLHSTKGISFDLQVFGTVEGISAALGKSHIEAQPGLKL